MFRRPLLWGIIAFVVFGFIWFVSVILSVITGGAFRVVANASGIAAAASVPVAVVLELVRWLRKSQAGEAPERTKSE